MGKDDMNQTALYICYAVLIVCIVLLIMEYVKGRDNFEIYDCGCGCKGVNSIKKEYEKRTKCCNKCKMNSVSENFCCWSATTKPL